MFLKKKTLHGIYFLYEDYILNNLVLCALKRINYNS